MALITCAGADVIRGRIHMPTSGAWFAELVLDTATAPSGSVTIAADNGLSIKGTVSKAGVFLDSANVRIVGGAGGLANPVTPSAFQRAQLSDALKGVTQASGDTLSSTVSADLLSTLLTAWVSTRKPAAQALDDLCAYVSGARGQTINWRYLDDGKLWLGAETWPSVTLPDTDSLLVNSPASGRQVIGVATPSLLPGVNLVDVGNVIAVDHYIEPDEIRTWAWTDMNHISQQLSDVVRAIVGLSLDPGTPPIIEKLAAYRAEVRVASSDGKTLDVKPENEDISSTGMSQVPVRVGIPGLTAVVVPGTTSVVLIGFEGGDPSRPYCMPAWEMGASVQKLAFDALAIELAGNSYSALKTEALLADLSTLMGYLVTWVPLVVSGVAASPSGTATDPGVATQALAIKTAITGGTYKSTKVKHG